ncbi:unnamed protein product, partial [Brenthis ino]
MGAYCYGKRDNRGEVLLRFCWENNLFIINSKFKKKEKNMWTWISPKKARSQIDYTLSNIKENITNFEILNKFSFASDHRLLRNTLFLANIKKSRASYNNENFKLKTKEGQDQFIKFLKANIEIAQLNENEDVESYHKKIKNAIEYSLKATKIEKRKTQSIISEDTKKRIRRRNELTNKKNLTKEERTEKTNLYKNIHKLIKKEYQDHKIKTIEKHLIKSGSLKKGLKELISAKGWIPCLKDISTEKKSFSRSKIIETATLFYKELYSNIQNTTFQALPTNQNLTTIKRFTIQEIAILKLKL